MSEKEVEKMGRATQFAVTAARMALADAGLDGIRGSSWRKGVIIGHESMVMDVGEKQFEVLTNLIFNALEAMPQGGRLSLSIGPSQRPGEVEIRVQDTGLGVPAEVKGKIFEPLFTTKGALNSGLGLSVSYGIVARCGGTIEVESQEGQGSTFIVRLRSLDR